MKKEVEEDKIKEPINAKLTKYLHRAEEIHAVLDDGRRQAT